MRVLVESGEGEGRGDVCVRVEGLGEGGGLREGVKATSTAGLPTSACLSRLLPRRSKSPFSRVFLYDICFSRFPAFLHNNVAI